MRKALRSFLALEASSGIVLMCAAVLALVLANSPFSAGYEALLGAGVRHAVNDGLMALFFLLVGLEIKREMLQGELAGWRRAALPLIGALGGIVLPAMIYLGMNHGMPAARGWAIASATDIAFSVGVLALLGSRIPAGLKIFLLAVAVIDDLVAVIIIAVFYTSELNLMALTGAGLALLLLYVAARVKPRSLWPYLALGVLLWWAVLNSGVHATIAGVALGFMIPMHIIGRNGKTLAKSLEHRLHPWVAYGIMPVFALANAGVSLAEVDGQVLLQPLPLGIALGLLVGKQLGIFTACRLAVALKIAHLPVGVRWRGLYGVCIIAGIGFTMSLFIGSLAFSDPVVQNEVRLGVMMGSIASALLGYIYLRCTLKPKHSI